MNVSEYNNLLLLNLVVSKLRGKGSANLYPACASSNAKLLNSSYIFLNDEG